MPYVYNNQKLKLKRKRLRSDMPQSERVLWYYLKGRHLKDHRFRRQYSVGNYILDFYCPELRLAIEIDGDSHFIDDNAAVHDQKRDVLLTEHNINIIHVTNSDVMGNINAVVNKILEYLP